MTEIIMHLIIMGALVLLTLIFVAWMKKNRR